MRHREGESASEHTLPSNNEGVGNTRIGGPYCLQSDGDDHADVWSSAAGLHRRSPAGPARLVDPLPDLHRLPHDLAGRVLAGGLWTAELGARGNRSRHKIFVFDDAGGL